MPFASERKKRSAGRAREGNHGGEKIKAASEASKQYSSIHHSLKEKGSCRKIKKRGKKTESHPKEKVKFRKGLL